MSNFENIKVVSLDVWNTIFSPSKQYAAARTKLLAEHFGVREITAKNIYSDKKKALDSAAEATGAAQNIVEAWKSLTDEFGGAGRSDHAIIDLMKKAQSLFIEFPPSVPKKLIEAISDLQQSGVVVGCLSNTNFISGNTILDHFSAIGINLDFNIFSDLCGYSKPHPMAFEKVFKTAKQLTKGQNLKAEEIIHIGDSYECDVLGAKRAGFSLAQNCNPDETTDVLTHLLFR